MRKLAGIILALGVLCSSLFYSFTKEYKIAGGKTLKGNYFGTVVQSEPKGDTYKVSMQLNGKTGTIDYPSLGCGGTLTFLRSEDGNYWYQEHITTGINKCYDGGTIQLVPRDNSIDWSWSGSGVIAYGNLAKVSKL